MGRREIAEYIAEKYGIGMECPKLRDPSYGVFRHADNKKPFAYLSAVPRAELGLKGQGTADALSVKTGDMFLRDMLAMREGFTSALWAGKGSWVSVLLDGTVPPDEIEGLIGVSFAATASSATKRAVRPPKDWIVPANPAYYDVVGAFEKSDEIDWKQGRGIKEGDTVYIYVGAPVSAVLFRCLVTKTDIPYSFSRDGLTIAALMKIRLTDRYDPSRFPFSVLMEKHGIRAVRGPRGIPESLKRAFGDAPGTAGREEARA